MLPMLTRSRPALSNTLFLMICVYLKKKLATQNKQQSNHMVKTASESINEKNKGENECAFQHKKISSSPLPKPRAEPAFLFLAKFFAYACKASACMSASSKIAAWFTWSMESMSKKQGGNQQRKQRTCVA
jgi:hypothetical protein